MLTSQNLVADPRQTRRYAAPVPRAKHIFASRLFSEQFAGLSRIERHRRVHEVLASELAGRVHALSLTTRKPEEGVW